MKKNNLFDYLQRQVFQQRRLLRCIAVFAFFLAPFLADASHIVGGDITYDFISNNGGSSLYRIRLKYFRDCSGIPAPTSVTVQITNTGFSTSLNLLRTSVLDKSILCPGQLSRCASTNGINGSLEEHVYEATISLAHNPNPYLVSQSVCCRSAGITNIVNPGSVNQYTSTTIRNTGLLNNSSPSFLNAPTGKYCTNQPQNISLSAFDIDGDALTYSIVPARSAANTNVTYIAGSSATNPFNNSGFALNPVTGSLQFTPTVANQRAVVAVRAEEFRNGVKIGEVIREFEVSTTNCGANSSPVISTIGNQIVLPGNTICIPIVVTDVNTTQALTLNVNSGIIPPATFNIDSTAPGYVRGIFCFTPTVANEGNSYAVNVATQDNFCPAPGQASSSFNVIVPNCNITISTSSTDADCGVDNGTASATLSGGVAPFSYNWSGPSSYTGTTPAISNLAAGNYTINIVDGNNCLGSTIVNVGGGASPIVQNATVVDATCGLSNGSISLAPSNGVAPYTFQLNNGAIQTNNDFLGLTQGSYTVAVQDATGCLQTNVYQVMAASDQTAPTLTCLNITTALDDHGDGSISENDVVIAVDNCSAVSLSLSNSFFDCSNLGANTVTVTGVDLAGNIATCTATVTVIDDIDPELECNNFILPLVNGNTVLTEGDVITLALDHTHEACGSNNFSISQFSFSCMNKGVNMVTLSETDNSGNIGSCVAEITIIDNTAPTAQTLAPINEECLAIAPIPTLIDDCDGIINGTTSDATTFFDQGTYVIHWNFEDNSGNVTTVTQNVTLDDITAPMPIITNLGDATAECNINVVVPQAVDNCAGLLTATTSDPTTFTQQGSYVIQWTYNDGNGNISTQNQNVIIQDVTAPVADVAALSDIVAECNASATAPTATDNCSGAIIATTTDPTTYAQQGAYVIHWTYNDGNGNISTQNQNVIIQDLTAPVADMATLNDIVAECNATATAPTATDNCSGAITATTTDPTSYTQQGAYVIHWTYDDGNGNISTQNQNVIIQDLTAPVADMAALNDIVAECNATATAPTATDNCSGTITATTTDPTSYTQQGSYVIHWTYNDGNGNISTQNQNVTIQDLTAPVADMATLSDIVAECSATATAPTATDNCSGTITATTTDPTSYTQQGGYTIHWTYDDGNGNVSTQNQTVLIHDFTPPTANCKNATVTLNSAGTAIINAGMVDNNSTDNCGITSITVAPSSFSCSTIGSQNVTLTVTDVQNNTSTCVAQVLVNPNKSIQFSNCSADINLTCNNANNNSCPGQVSGAVGTWTTPKATLVGPCVVPCIGGNAIAGHVFLGTYNGRSYYRSIGTNFDWNQAKNAAITAGGNLVSITSSGENNWIKNKLSSSNNCYSADLWIGLNDMATEGTYVWSNGDPNTYTNWGSGEPNNNGGCNCNNTQGDYVAYTPSNGKWFDRNICNKYGYILEIGCVNPVTMVQISGPASGANFASGTTTPITYLAYTAAGDSAYCTFNVIVSECLPVYCAPPNSSTQYEFIKKVEFNTINNLSGNNNGYGNFSAMSTNVTKGSIIPITLTPGFKTNCTYTEYWRVYIDWNYDGDFNDAFEMAASGFGNAAITRNITVPNSATVNKNLKMRIVMRYGGYPTTACLNSSCHYGETEDYTIEVESTSGRSAEVITQTEVVDEKALLGDLEISNLYPNPISNNASEINITYRIAAASDVKIQVLTMSGKVITEQNIAAVVGENRATMQLPQLTAGTYLVNVANQNGQQSKKLVVE